MYTRLIVGELARSELVTELALEHGARFGGAHGDERDRLPERRGRGSRRACA